VPFWNAADVRRSATRRWATRSSFVDSPWKGPPDAVLSAERAAATPRIAVVLETVVMAGRTLITGS
jgi:hypothetical protein